MKSNSHLLLVDDDPDDRELFIAAIKEIDAAIECSIAADGIQALARLRNPAYPLPDLIFLDISMPRLNGKNCLAEIKADTRLRHIPVIICTTSRDVEEAMELKKMGALHYMSKPRNAEDIYFLAAFALEQYLYEPASL